MFCIFEVSEQKAKEQNERIRNWKRTAKDLTDLTDVESSYTSPLDALQPNDVGALSSKVYLFVFLKWTRYLDDPILTMVKIVIGGSSGSNDVVVVTLISVMIHTAVPTMVKGVVWPIVMSWRAPLSSSMTKIKSISFKKSRLARTLTLASASPLE